MESKLISLKEIKPKNYEIYLGDIVIGSIIDNSKLFGLKRTSYCELKINDKDYRLNCIRKSSGGDGNSSDDYYVFELFILENKKIAEFQCSLYFFVYRVWNALVFSTDRVNYFEYYKNLSVWMNADKIKVANIRKDIFEFDEVFIKKDSEDLNIIVIVTALIEKFIYKKLKRDSGYFIALLVILGIFIVFGIVIYLKFKN